MPICDRFVPFNAATAPLSQTRHTPSHARHGHGHTVKPVTTDRRRKLGSRGEQIAADHLVRRGFTILERNYRSRWGEIDIVAYDGSQIVFCEVKSRLINRDGRDPLESLHRRKRLQVRHMASEWLATRSHPRAPGLRFDAIGVTLTPEGELVRLDHLEGAF